MAPESEEARESGPCRAGQVRGISCTSMTMESCKNHMFEDTRVGGAPRSSCKATPTEVAALASVTVDRLASYVEAAPTLLQQDLRFQGCFSAGDRLRRTTAERRTSVQRSSIVCESAARHWGETRRWARVSVDDGANAAGGTGTVAPGRVPTSEKQMLAEPTLGPMDEDLQRREPRRKTYERARDVQ